MGVFLLTLVVLGVIYFFGWSHFRDYMDVRIHAQRLESALHDFESSNIEGYRRYTPIDNDVTAPFGVYVLSVFDDRKLEVVSFPVLTYRFVGKSVFKADYLCIQIGDHYFQLHIRPSDITDKEDGFLVSLSGGPVNTILEALSLGRGVARLSVVGGDFRRQYTLDSEEQKVMIKCLELSQLLGR